MVEDPTSAAEAHGHALASIIRGMAVALVGSLLGGGLGFLFSVAMARQLSVADFGLLVLALNLLDNAIALVIGGADYATIRYVAAADTPGRQRGAMATPLLVVLALNVVVALAVVALARPIAVHLLDQPRLTNVLRALAVVLPLTTLATMFSACLSGLEQTRGELARKVTEQAGRIVFASAAIALGFGLVGAVLGLAAAAAFSSAAVGWLLLRSLPRGGETERLPLRPVLGFSWPQTAAKIAGELWMLLLFLVLAHAEGARSVALLGAALGIARLPGLVYNAFSFRFSPTISRLWARGERDELGELLKGVTRWISMAAVPLYASAIALPGALLHVYGSRYAPGATALAVIALASLLNSLAGPVERALIMTGRVRLEMASNVVTAVLTAPVAVALTYAFGLDGAAFGVLAYTLMLNALKTWFVWRTMRLHTVSRALAGPILAAALASLVAAGLAAVTSLDQSLPGAIVLALVLVAVYVLLLVRIVGLSRADRHAFGLALGRSAGAGA